MGERSNLKSIRDEIDMTEKSIQNLDDKLRAAHANPDQACLFSCYVSYLLGLKIKFNPMSVLPHF